MNNDRIANTPGGERMLWGAIALAIAVFAYAGLRYELGQIGRVVLLVIFTYGLYQFGRGLVEWKYSDPKDFVASKARENLYVDIPLKGQPAETLNIIEDALIQLIRSSKSVAIKMQSIDTANNVGTVHLTGMNSDAMYAHVFSTLAPFVTKNGLHLFPKPGQPIDTEIHGKRLLLDMPSRELI
jgi:hypothetical protein